MNLNLASFIDMWNSPPEINTLQTEIYKTIKIISRWELIKYTFWLQGDSMKVFVSLAITKKTFLELVFNKGSRSVNFVIKKGLS